MKKAVYAGSFDPFHNGHLYIYEQAKELFDEVVVMIANNPNKKRFTDIADIRHYLVKMNINAFAWSGLVADWCKQNDVYYLVRGLRSTSDYLYEEEVAKINAEINPELKTVYFRAKDNISSTMVRLLHEQGKDISKYIPEIKLTI